MIKDKMLGYVNKVEKASPMIECHVVKYSWSKYLEQFGNFLDTLAMKFQLAYEKHSSQNAHMAIQKNSTGNGTKCS